MMKVFIPLAEGDSLMPEVTEGLAKNKLIAMPITSKRTENMHISNIKNWIKALEINNEDYFIGMDSDVVLAEKTIESLVEHSKDDVELVGFATQDKHFKSTPDNMNVAHSFMFIRDAKAALLHLRKLKREGYQKCCWCHYIHHLIDSNKKYRLVKQPRLYECDRVEIGGSKHDKV